jgi:hypothetical protein
MQSIHPKLTIERVMRAVGRNNKYADSNIGFCLACGRKAKQSCEPDAAAYECQYKSCGQRQVFGAEEILIMLA